MVYLVSHETATYGVLEYDRNNVLGYEDFWQDFRIGATKEPLRYRLKRRSDAPKLKARHLIESTYAPLLVSSRFRTVVETAARNDAEFIPAVVQTGDQEITDLWAINVIQRVSAVDMEKSEYEQTNFDPNNPRYMFSYTMMLENWDSTASIAICAEQPNRFVVTEAVKQACIEAELKGLIFFSALDMTYADRTVCERIT